MGEYGPHPSKLGTNTDLQPSAVDPYWPQISQNIGPYSPIRPLQSHCIVPIYEDFGSQNIEKMHKKIILTQMHWLPIKNGREGIKSDDVSEVFLRLNFQSSSVQKMDGTLRK